MPPLVPPDQLEAVARRFRLLSEPVRLELLNALDDPTLAALCQLVRARLQGELPVDA